MTALGGHINHLYEDFDLRFRDLKSIFKIISHADIDVYEKLDGQNLFIGWDFQNEKLKTARNKQNIKDGGLDRYGLSLKFGDRPEIEALFTVAYDVLLKAIGSLNHNIRTQIFGSMGTIWFPIEIINPDFPNTIHYSKKSIVFHEHGPVLFGMDGEPISNGLPRNLEMLKNSIPLMNEVVDSWEIVGPKCFPLKPIDESIALSACSKLDEIQRISKITDGTTIRSYLSKRLQEDMQRFVLIPEYIRSGVSKAIVKMTGAPTIKSMLMSVDSNVRKLVKSMIDEEKNVILPKLLSPIENIVHIFSSHVLSNIKSEYIEDISFESERIKKEYDRCCNVIRNSNDHKNMTLLSNMHPKIGTGIVTIEGLVFKFNDKIYKITGSYAPMNRIIAAVHYGEKKKQINVHDVPLALFMQSS